MSECRVVLGLACHTRYLTRECVVYSSYDQALEGLFRVVRVLEAAAAG